MTTENASLEVQNAAALAMLATHCAVCRRELRDPISVELGIGPDCRKRYKFDASTVTPEAYAEAKALIYKLAMLASSGLIDASMCYVASDRLKELGFEALSEIIVKKNTKICITAQADGRLLVRFPYEPAASHALYSLGANPHRDTRGKFAGYLITPALANATYNRVLRRFFAGQLGVGPKGTFIVKAPPAVSGQLRIVHSDAA